MTSSIDTPILIDSDNDSDVEILREERNEDLDIIFVSETIHVKEEEKPSAENIKSESKPFDTSFNRSLSISSNLDLTLRLTDNPTPPSVDQTPCSNTNSAMSAIDHAPLDLSSKAKYDDITDSSEEGSSEEDYDEDDDDDEDVGSDDPFAIKGPDNGGSILSMPRLYNSDQSQPSNCCSKPQSFNISDILSTGNSTQGRKKLPSQIRVLKSYNQTLQPIDSVSSYQIKQDCTQSLYSSMTSAGPQQTQHQSNDQSTQSMTQQTICNSVHYQQTLTLKESHDKIQSQQGIWNPSDHATQSNISTSGTNSVTCNPSFSSSPNKTVTDICDELLQDLDFLNSSNNSLSSHSKLCKTTSSGDQELKTSPPAVGIKRTLSEQNLKSKSDDKILPPKKQTRYLYHQSSEETQSSSSSWGSEKCSQCQMSLLGLKLSRCLQGHPSCTTCLEEKVKVVLTGKAKETLHCLKPGCNSYFPIGELNQSLPKMVVDILETKLDDDYIDYIANMILKNASSSEDSGHNINSQEVPSVPENRSTGCTADNKLERNKDLPDNWTVMDRKKTHDLVALEPESPEYVDVVFKFHESMKFPLADICKVSRIQNPILWQFFNVKRSEMIQENDGIDVEERKLFHGTQAAIVESICKKGFDWRVCGKNGTVYGQGCYFAVNANYSHQYTDKPTRRNRLPRPFMPVPPPAHFHIQGGTGLMVPIMVNPLSMNLAPGQFGQQPNNNSASQNFQQLRVYTRPSTSSNTSQGNCLLYTNIQAGQQVSTQNNGASGQRAVGSQSPSAKEYESSSRKFLFESDETDNTLEKILCETIMLSTLVDTEKFTQYTLHKLFQEYMYNNTTKGKLLYLWKHEKYNTLDGGIEPDLMLLQLKTPLKFGSTVNKIDLDKDTGKNYTGELCTISGWGTTNASGSNYPDRLQVLLMPVVSKEYCLASWSFSPTFLKNIICLQDGKKDSCNRDSGGPLVCSKKLVGVLSFGAFTICDGRVPSVHIRVSAYTDWIEEKLKNKNKKNNKDKKGKNNKNDNKGKKNNKDKKNNKEKKNNKN